MKKFIFVFNILLILSLMTFVGCSNNNTNNETGNIKGTEGIHYQKISGKEEYQVVGIGTASELDIVIPKEYNGLPITKIADYAFRNEKNIEIFMFFNNLFCQFVNFFKIDVSWSTFNNNIIEFFRFNYGEHFFQCSF